VRTSLLLLAITGCTGDVLSGGGVDASTGGAIDAPAIDSAVAVDGAPADGATGRDFSSDRTKFFGASRCAQANVQLCEDFESGTLDTAIWSVTGTRPVIDGMQAARGAKALHITQNGNGPSYIKETRTFPAMNNKYWGRMFIYFQSLPGPPMTYAHWTFAAGSGTGVSGEIRLSGQFQNGRNLFGVGTDNRVDPNGTGDWTTSDNDPAGQPVAVPLHQWLCIEWLHDGAANETRFYWDATEHPSLHTTASMHGGNTNPYDLPMFTNVWVGWDEYQPSTETFEMWIDEIAIDKERIGCVL
jgi:hypothetical protein